MLPWEEPNLRNWPSTKCRHFECRSWPRVQPQLVDEGAQSQTRLADGQNLLPRPLRILWYIHNSRLKLLHSTREMNLWSWLSNGADGASLEIQYRLWNLPTCRAATYTGWSCSKMPGRRLYQKIALHLRSSSSTFTNCINNPLIQNVNTHCH
jgi:hypothetical protein